MKRHWVLFLAIVLSAIAIIAYLSSKEVVLSDKPERIPSKNEVVPPGSSTNDLVKTSDPSKIGLLLQPTALVRTSTRNLLSISCSHGTDWCKAEAIYDYVRLNYEYKPSTPEHTWIQSPGETLIYGSGDQLDLGIMIASMYRAAGFNSEILQGPYHVFVRTKVLNETVMIDPGCQGCRFLDVGVQLNGDEMVFS